MRINLTLLANISFGFGSQPVVFSQETKLDQVRMTTPGAPWTIVIEGKNMDLRRVNLKADERSAYFLLLNEKNGLNVSLFIEPAGQCKTSEECRDFVLNTGNPSWGEYQGLAKSSIESFSYFEFFRPEVRGLPLKMQDMYAEYVSDGFWVDLHISKVQYTKDDRQLFEKMVRSLKFVRRNGNETDSSVTLDNTLRITTEKWLALWDAGKCRESYAGLTSISRTAVSEKQWTDYCVEGNKSLGSLKSRKFLAGTYMPSMPGMLGRSGATIRFRRMLESGPVVEFVSLTTEKNGSWTVSNYIIQS